MSFLFNVLGFKVAWLSSVMGAAKGFPALGPIVVLFVVALHLYRSSSPRRELMLVVMTGAIGLTWDSIMVALGWLSYESGAVAPGLAPYWIIAMWMSFATTLNLSFRWLRDRPVLASLLGAISGPASYLIGANLGAVTFLNQQMAVVGMAVAWSVLMPVLLLLARHYDGYERQYQHQLA
ncbi:MAG: DUF2878 domain-containing protein [Pseudomonadota bacterium]